MLNAARERSNKQNTGRIVDEASPEGTAVALGLAAPFALSAGSALAEDTLKMAIGQINNWENQPPTLGQDAGIFKKHDL